MTQLDSRTFQRISFTQGQPGNDMTGPGGYVITHVFQGQDDDGHNVDQYTEVVSVEYWDAIPGTLEHLMTYCHGAGYTVSITVAPAFAMDGPCECHGFPMFDCPNLKKAQAFVGGHAMSDPDFYVHLEEPWDAPEPADREGGGGTSTWHDR